MKNYNYGTQYDFGEVIEKSKKVVPKCYESHPALKIGEYEIYGGSCSHPVVSDADIYVGLDYGMTYSAKAYPWNGATRTEIYFPVTDMYAPSDPKEFHKMVCWLADRLHAGDKIHVGCIGGHGRTGTLFAALVKHMTGNENAIQYVRDNYCEKAVETAEQIQFLVKHYGIKSVKSTKKPYKGGSLFPVEKGSHGTGGTVYPVKSNKSIFG
jgi:hypothetical protein